MKIALIDDDEVNHYIIKQMIRFYDPGIVTESYFDGGTALNQIKENEFDSDLILLDIHMLPMDGWEFLAEYEKFEKEIPIYILSTSNAFKDVERSITFSSVKGYIIKPLEIKKLDQILGNTAGQHFARSNNILV